MSKESYTSWAYNLTENSFVATPPTISNLPAGYYQVFPDRSNKPCANLIKIKQDPVCYFDNGPFKNVFEEVETFWSSEDKYTKFGMSFKRGIIFHGKPGCGKTGLVHSLIKQHIENDGLVIRYEHYVDVISFAPALSSLEKNRRILMVIEDLDGICRDPEDEEDLLSIMDGANSEFSNKILWIATTNNLDKIPHRIRSRPSRFDTCIEIPLPSKEVRLEYINFISSDFKEFFTEEFKEELVEKSHGFSLAGLKEVILSVAVYNKTLDDSIEKIKNLQKEQEDE